MLERHQGKGRRGMSPGEGRHGAHECLRRGKALTLGMWRNREQGGSGPQSSCVSQDVSLMSQAFSAVAYKSLVI